MQVIPLHRLAEAMGLELTTALRWVRAGIIRCDSPPLRGKGNFTSLTREQATEALAIILLRRAGAPMQQLRPLVERLRREGKHGRAFLTLGADRRRVLLDGLGPGVPLRDPKTGQTRLFAALDLRELRPELERILDSLALDSEAGSTHRETRDATT
jgi:hypothetical protein